MGDVDPRSVFFCSWCILSLPGNMLDVFLQSFLIVPGLLSPPKLLWHLSAAFIIIVVIIIIIISVITIIIIIIAIISIIIIIIM